MKKTFIIVFWTPSDSTAKGLDPKNAEDSAEYIWQTKFNHLRSIASLNVDFGRRIKDDFEFKGYRRSKVIGESKTKMKEVWWWYVAFDGNCDALFLKRFKETYIDFWNTKAKGSGWDNLHIEVIGNYKE